MHHKDLEVWKYSMDLVVEIYKETESFPKEEMFSLTSQMRRCAVSIPSNIAEGCGRYSDKETSRFISVALGSLAELDTQIILAERLGYLKSHNRIIEDIKKTNALLVGLKKHLEKCIE